MKADFIEHTTTAGHGRNEWAQTTWADMKAKGATFGRISHPIDAPDNLWLEGWKVRPDGQGPHPWEGGCRSGGGPVITDGAAPNPDKGQAPQ